jgi:hypothetical protein
VKENSQDRSDQYFRRYRKVPVNIISLRSLLPPSHSPDAVIFKAGPHRPYNPRLQSYLRFALDVIEEHDLPYPDEDSLLGILEAALDARVLLVQSSVHPRTPDQLEELLRKLLLFALQPTIESEVI